MTRRHLRLAQRCRPRHALSFALSSALSFALSCALVVPVSTAAAAAEAATSQDASPSSAASEAPQPLAEATRNTARATAEWLARGIDGWFGDKPFEQGGKVSDGRLELGLFKRRDQSADVDLRFSAHFRLPNIEQRAYLFVGRDDPRNAVQDKPEATTASQRLLSERSEDRGFLAGLGLGLPNHVDLRLGVSAHLRPYVQARWRQLWLLAPGRTLELRETLFWTRSDRLGSTTVLSLEQLLTPQLAVRWLNTATITQNSRNFDWSSTLGAYRALPGQRLVSLELLAAGTGTQGQGVGRSDLGVLAHWEQPIYRDWLRGEVVGGHFWPRPDAQSPRGRAWALGGSLKLRF